MCVAAKLPVSHLKPGIITSTAAAMPYTVLGSWYIMLNRNLPTDEISDGLMKASGHSQSSQTKTDTLGPGSQDPQVKKCKLTRRKCLLPKGRDLKVKYQSCKTSMFVLSGNI